MVCLSLRSELSPGRQQGPWFSGSVCSLLRWFCSGHHRLPHSGAGAEGTTRRLGTCRGRVLSPHLHRQADHTAGNSCREHSRRLQLEGLLGKAGGKLVRPWRTGSPHTLLVGMYIWCSHCGNSVEIPQKMLEKNYLLIQQSHCWIYF